MSPPVPPPPGGSRWSEWRRGALRHGVAWVRAFFADGLHDYASALAHRGLLALVPAAIVGLTAIDGFALGTAMPELQAWLARIRPAAGGDLSLGRLLSVTAAVGAWSLSTSARTLMRALNAAHGVAETRSGAVRAVLSVVALPGLAVVIGVTASLLVLTSRTLAAVVDWVGLGGLSAAVAPGWRLGLGLGLVAGVVAAVYRWGPATRAPWRAIGVATVGVVSLGAALTWGATATVVLASDYGRAYGPLGTAVTLLVYLYASFLLLLGGARLTATLAARRAEAGRGALGGRARRTR